MIKIFSQNGYEHGRSFHHGVLISLALIFFASLVLFASSSLYYNELVAPSSLYQNRYSTAQLIFYIAPLPTLSLAHSVLQLVISNRNMYLVPIAMFGIGVPFLIGWIIVASIWTHCEIVLPNSNTKSLPGWCPGAVLYNQSGVVFDNDLAITRGTFAWILTILYMVYLLYACLACWKERRADNEDHGLGINLEGSPELREHTEEFFY